MDSIFKILCKLHILIYPNNNYNVVDLTPESTSEETGTEILSKFFTVVTNWVLSKNSVTVVKL